MSPEITTPRVKYIIRRKSSSLPQSSGKPSPPTSKVDQGDETPPLLTPAIAATDSPPKSPAELREELIAAIGRYPQIKDVPWACSSVPMISTPPCERYRECLSRGEPMPPVLISDDGYLLDGRHRVLAASRLGLELEFEVTSRNFTAIAYEGLIARKATKSQVAVFAANLITAIKHTNPYTAGRKHACLKVLNELCGTPFNEKNYSRRKPFRGNISDRVAKAFGISKTLVRQAVRLTWQERISVVDGRAIYRVLQDRRTAENR